MNKLIPHVLGTLAFVKFVRDPTRLDDVFSLADTFHDDPKLGQELVDFHKRNPVGARAYAERPRIGAIDLDALARLPPDTLGHTFSRNLRANGLDPAALPTRPAESDTAYTAAHIYETHDVWHVLTGFGTDVAGELGLQAFYLAQAPARVSSAILAGGLANAFLFAPGDTDARMNEITRGWYLGRRAQPLFGHDWKEHWATPVADLRARFGIDLEELNRTLPPRASL